MSRPHIPIASEKGRFDMLKYVPYIGGAAALLRFIQFKRRKGFHDTNSFLLTSRVFIQGTMVVSILGIGIYQGEKMQKEKDMRKQEEKDQKRLARLERLKEKEAETLGKPVL